MTRIGILIAWVGGVAMALSFGQMLGLWVFMATILVSTVLVPIMIGLYVPGWRVPLAGMLSSATGLASVVVLNSAIVFGGEYVDALETYVLVVDVAGMQWTVLQEYVMLFSVPASLIALLAGLIIHKVKQP